MPQHPRDVLIVDDDPDLVQVMRLMLTGAGFEVRCAANGREALAAVEQRAPAVVLLDMLMPVMDGWQCARELRARYGNTIPIVVVTAAEHARARAAEIGSVDAVLPKPFDFGELVEIVERYVDGHG